MIGNMSNVATLTDQLALMPDRQLPMLAQQYKNDAITLSLILNEKNRRDRLRNAPKMAEAQAQPKVNDEVVASMQPQPQLPEQVGIGALPAPNMQNMADGGIAGMPDGSNAALQYNNEPVLRMAGGGEVRRFNGAAGSFTGPVMTLQQFIQSQGLTVSEFNRMAPEAQQQIREAFKSLGYGAPSGTPSSAAPKAAPTASSGSYAQQPKPFASMAGQGFAAPTAAVGLGGAALSGLAANYVNRLSPEAREQLMGDIGSDTGFAAAILNQAEPTPTKTTASTPVATTAATSDYTQDLAPGMQAGQKIVNTPPPPAPPAPTQQQVVIPTAGLLNTKPPTAEEAKQQAGQFVDFSKAETDLSLMRANQRMRDEALIKTYEDTKPKTPAYQGLEALLDKESKETATEKDKAGLWAVFNGFLEMAAGESPHALTNIAKGVLKGSSEYSTAMKDIKKIERENMKMRADIEQARRAEARDDQKTLLGLQKDIADRQTKIDELGIGLISTISKTKADTATSLFRTGVEQAAQNARTMVEQAGQNARTTAQLNAPTGIERLVGRMQTDPKFAAAYKDYASISPEAKGDAAILAKYATADGQMALKMMEASQDPQERALAASIKARLQASMLTPTTAPTGPVRP